MCGIIGAFEPKIRNNPGGWARSDMVRMTEARDLMVRRGPDGAGLWHDQEVLFGHRRLSILDLSEGGHQPMLSSRGTAIVFNGEIYNYVELRYELQQADINFNSTSDTEVLLAAYEHWGLDKTLSKIRGMFAFAIWDPRERMLHLARDPIGKKPLYLSLIHI